MKKPKPFVFNLNEEEANYILGTSITGNGGRQSFQAKLSKKLMNGNRKLEFTDEQFGKLCRYMSSYGNGGAQERLRNAFNRHIKSLMNY